MSYVDLRHAFDDLAYDIFATGYAMRTSECRARIHELYGLALQTLEAAQGRDDVDEVAATIGSILHRAYSISSTLKQCEMLRGKLARMPATAQITEF